MTRALTYAVLLVAMIAFGFGVYRAATLLKTDSTHVVKPSATSAPSLPGTLVVAQDGALYRLRDGQFTQITDSAGWTEPAASPDGSQLVAVRRIGNFSDLYLLTSTGRIERQLTHHHAGPAEANHWSFFPRFSADGTQVFYSYDAKVVGSYQVDLAIFAMSLEDGTVVQWTTPNAFTGGDVNPIPLKGGGLIYTKYSIDDQSQVHGQVWFQARPATDGVALTQPADNCGAPAVSADGTLIAMVCRHSDLQSADVVVESLGADGTPGAPKTLVQGQLATAPVFSPDGKTVAFLAPVVPGGAFQLWTVPVDASKAASQARAVTSNVGLDSTAAPVWVG
jgi:Tol biopolymer transport system component